MFEERELDKNADLVGLYYINGPDGHRYRVLRVCRNDREFVAAVRVSDGTPTTALAAFVREFLVN